MMFVHCKWLLFGIFLLAGCDLPLVRNPAGSMPYPAGAQTPISSPSVPQPQRQVPSSYRIQQAWDKAMQGMTMGGAFAGVYGAGAGLVVGLLTGLFTADAEYAQLTDQIQSEQAKDKELEAKLQEEMQRQRELDNRLANKIGIAPPQTSTEPLQSAPNPKTPNPAAAAQKENLAMVSSVSNKESPAKSSGSPFKNVDVKDVDGDTIPDLWIYYNPLKPGEKVRQEEATHGDGRVDTWSYFKDGKLVRREVDTKSGGTADTFYYYENDKIAREERDENGTGKVSLRVLYQNGRRAKVEKDSNGGGKPDIWIYYDVSTENEIVLKEEQDLNGDGAVDLWSYYENGRLVRRDLSAAGLELVSTPDQVASFSTNSTQPSRPQPVRDQRERSARSGRTGSK
jgi:antitoxin component YwqK of YwqJK toxin-antitoxin module